MKAKIHPAYFPEAKVVCVCGNTFTTGSTVEHISVEVCSKCHPFYTGEQRFADTKGKIEGFRKKMEVAAELQKKRASTKKRAEERSQRQTKSLKELLSES